MAKDRQRSSDPIDQVELVLSAINDPKERAQMLFDPQAYAIRKNVRLDQGFVNALRAEVDNLNKQLLSLEEEQLISLPRVDDPRISEMPSFTTGPGEVAFLPAIVAAAEVVAAVAAAATAVVKLYQAVKKKAF